MKIAMAVLYKTGLYHYTFDEITDIQAGDFTGADLMIYGLKQRFEISCEEKKLEVRLENKQFDVPINKFVIVDKADRLAFFCTEVGIGVNGIRLPRNCEVRIGRDAKISQEGQDNQIVIDLPFVSAHHFKLIRTDGRTMVYDNNSTNGIYVNGERVNSAWLNNGDIVSILTVKMTYKDDKLFFENVGSHMMLRRIDSSKVMTVPKKQLSETDFHFSRSPRLTSVVRMEVIDIEKPPQKTEQPQINWVSILLMPAISITLMVLMVLVLGINSVMLIMSGVTSIVSAIVAVINYRKQKTQNVSKAELIDQKYNEYLKSVESRLESERKRQLDELLKSNPAPQECFYIVEEKSRRLWERDFGDPDFLSVRLGTGTIPAAVTAKYKQPQVVLQESELEAKAKALSKISTSIHDAPVICDVAKHKQIGVVGQRTRVVQIARNIIVELATAHSYEEVKIIALLPEDELSDWEWLRWLPHCCDKQSGKRYVYTNADDAEALLDEISEVLGRRSIEQKDYSYVTSAQPAPHYVFIAATPMILEKHSIRKHLFNDEELGCSSLFLYDKLGRLPKDCNAIIDVTQKTGETYSSANSENRVSFTMDEFSVDDADAFARAMAPLFVSQQGGEYALAKSVSFLNGYGVLHPEELNIEERWKRAKTYMSLSVPIAAAAGNEVFSFDIHEKRHGVCGIVAGMPGSGKTEMVQSYLLSLAVNFSPQDVSFVLIDFKGTGMIAPFRNLPHLAGSISNLNTNIDRNLIAIQSELRRRETIIARYSNKNIKNINDLNKAYDNGIVLEKLPILLIVIDEYAEFKKNYPDFGAEIDSLTSKGRSLGIFVILMTQKPAGVVSPKSEDNIKFRWCLRVANYSASREMLGCPDAAKINTPGRAYIKVGEDDVFEQVQAFWSGAEYDPQKKKDTNTFTAIKQVTLSGERLTCEQKPETRSVQSNESEIAAVVSCIARYCKANRIEAAKKVWTEELPKCIALPELMTEYFNGRVWPKLTSFAPVIGLTDDPALQRQYPQTIDFAQKGHTIVYGAPTTGKTTLLKTFIMSAAMTRQPDELSMYIMDFGGWNLDVFKDLPHIGGIVHDDDPDRLKKQATLITEILDDRKQRFSKAGVGNIAAYRQATGEELPDVVLIVDNFGPVLKLYPDLDAFFVNLTGNGANYGIYLLATATSTNTVPFKIAQNVKNAIALQMIEKSDYTNTVGKTNVKLPAVMGRGLVKGNPPLEFQTALPMPGDDDKTVSEGIRSTAAAMNRVWNGDRPERIPEMPDIIRYGSVRADGVCVGLSTDKVRPIELPFAQQHYLLISSLSQDAGANLLTVIGKQMQEKMSSKLYVFDVNENMPEQIKHSADKYITDAHAIDSFVEDLRPEMQKRHAQKQAKSVDKFEPITILINDYNQFYAPVSNDTIQRLQAIVKMGTGMEIYLIVADEAYALASMVNKGEAVALSMAKGKFTLTLGGTLNDHGAIQTKVTYTQKTIEVREDEGYYICSGEPLRFKTMCKTEENVQ